MASEQPRPVPFAPDFRIADWLVEPSLDQLSRNGNVVRLRPQLTNLLVLLARHAGRTVSKDEILSKVWEGHFVAESGMTRCIAEIRHALGDDAREPKILETIPKRGYRVVAPVVFLEADAPPQASPEPPAPARDLPSEPPEPGHRGEQRDAQPEPTQRRRFAFRWVAGIFLVTSALLAVAWATGAWSRAPVLTERDSVLLADVVNTTGDPAFDHTLRLALAVQLGQAPFLHILPADHIRGALRRMGLPQDKTVSGPLALEVCRREGAAVLLAGSIARLGSHYALGLEAIACRTGEPIGSELLEVDDKNGVLAALGTGTARLRRKLGESRASLLQYDVPIVQATTGSLEALQALSLGDVNRDHARLSDALAFYRRATELDPQFALAWARRGAAARNVRKADADERWGGVSEPIFAFRKAYELSDRVSEPERLYIQGHYYRFVEGDMEKAIETYLVWKRTYPGSVVPPTNLASLYNTLGRYEEAVQEAREAVRLAPYSSIASSALVVAYLGSNRVPEARRALSEAASRGIDDLIWHELAFQLAFADGDAGAMAEHVSWASRSRSATVVMTYNRALAAACSGRLRESRRLWAEAAAAAREGESSGRSALEIIEAEAEALLGDAGAARAAADSALALDRSPGTLLGAAITLTLAGNPERGRALLEEAPDPAADSLSLRHVLRPVGRALLEADQGRFDDALDELSAAANFERGRDFGLAPLGVRALIELDSGRGLQAAATFRQLLNSSPVAPLSPWVPFARLGLARSLRQAGDVAGSRAAYEALIDCMKNADADAPLLTAARREVAALPLH